MKEVYCASANITELVELVTSSPKLLLQTGLQDTGKH